MRTPTGPVTDQGPPESVVQQCSPQKALFTGHLKSTSPCSFPSDYSLSNPLLIDWIYCEDKRTISTIYLYLLEKALFEKVLLSVCLNKLGTHNKFIPKYRGSSIRAWNSAFPSEVNLLNFHLISPMNLFVPFAVGFAFLPSSHWMQAWVCFMSSQDWLSLEYYSHFSICFMSPKPQASPALFLILALVSRNQTHIKSQGPSGLNPVIKKQVFSSHGLKRITWFDFRYFLFSLAATITG